MTVGLKRGSLELVSYDPEWEIFFDNEKNRIRKTIGHIISAIEHVGSTSIKNMCSKSKEKWLRPIDINEERVSFLKDNPITITIK